MQHPPPKQPKDEVLFHPEQLKYLERMFPEQIMRPEVSNDAVRHYNGQRSVIKFIANKIRG